MPHRHKDENVRIINLILQSEAPFYLQMTRGSAGGSTAARHFVDIMHDITRQDQVPNLDIWTWDTAAALLILQTRLFTHKINSAAAKAVKRFRNELSHFNVDMSFSKGFDSIDSVLASLGIGR